MPSLHDMQRGFAAAILGTGVARSPTIRGDGLSPALRLGFYKTSVMENYRSALKLSYPVVERLVGKTCFAELAAQYVRRYGHSTGDLTTFGDQFDSFLSGGSTARDLPYLSDMARLEWAMEEVFGEADHPSLGADRLANLPLDRCNQLRFMLHPASRLLSSIYPLRRIWQLAQSPSDQADTVDRGEGGERVLIWREGFVVTLEPLQAGEYALLSALAIGQDFGTAFGYGREADAGLDPAAFLRKFVSKGVLVDFTLPAEAMQ